MCSVNQCVTCIYARVSRKKLLVRDRDGICSVLPFRFDLHVGTRIMQAACTTRSINFSVINY